MFKISATQINLTHSSTHINFKNTVDWLKWSMAGPQGIRPGVGCSSGAPLSWHCAKSWGPRIFTSFCPSSDSPGPWSGVYSVFFNVVYTMGWSAPWREYPVYPPFLSTRKAFVLSQPLYLVSHSKRWCISMFSLINYFLNQLFKQLYTGMCCISPVC